MADEPDNDNDEETPDQAPEASVPDGTVDEAPVQAPDAANSVQTNSVQTDSASQLSSKERRRTARSAHTGEARPARSPEERHAERAAERKTKAVRRRARRLQERTKRVAARDRDGTDAASARQPLAPVHAQTEGVRKVRQGIVVSDKADKTITVRIDTARRHRRYEKIVRSSSTLHAHDENNDAHEGDTVRVIESRPLSRTKRWRLVDVLERAR
jgi:small subunit ribosomal protein S17